MILSHANIGELNEHICLTFKIIRYASHADSIDIRALKESSIQLITYNECEYNIKWILQNRGGPLMKDLC